MKDKLLVRLGESLKSHRKAMGVSQEYVANKSNLSRSYYGHLERGNKNISVINLSKIYQVLNINSAPNFLIKNYAREQNND